MVLAPSEDDQYSLRLSLHKRNRGRVPCTHTMWVYKALPVQCIVWPSCRESPKWWGDLLTGRRAETHTHVLPVAKTCSTLSPRGSTSLLPHLSASLVVFHRLPYRNVTDIEKFMARVKAITPASCLPLLKNNNNNSFNSSYTKISQIKREIESEEEQKLQSLLQAKSEWKSQLSPGV